MNSLNIYFDKQIVGSLTYDSNSDSFDFIYDIKWIKDGFELSPCIKFDDKFLSKTIKNFIENLLPEGSGRELLSIKYHISKNNIFALVQLIGKETTGALSFTNEVINTSFTKVSTEELAHRIRIRKDVPISIWDDKIRLSIAGVQDKLPICILDNEYGFGEGDLSSTHILKFEKNDENLVLNEYLSLKLASNAGLSVAPAKIVNIEDQEVLLVTRFDRKIIASNKIQRKHIIDACQMLDLAVVEKYERVFGSNISVKEYREGASFKKVFSLIKLCDYPIIAKKNIITWICVNLCLGNSDAHGKNLSFMIEKDKISLAPFYDIVNISMYKDLYETDFAMGIDDAFNYDELGSYQIIEFCSELDMQLKGFVKEFFNVSSSIIKSLKEEDFNLKTKNQKAFFNKYKTNVETRVEKLNEVVKYSLTYSN